MGWGAIAVATFLLGWGLVRFGVVPPPHAVLLIWIQGGQMKLVRGRLRAQAREFVAEILRREGINKGFIAVTPGKSVSFSLNISNNARQRLRNVLLNL